MRKPDPGPAGVLTRQTHAASSSARLTQPMLSRLLSPTTFSYVSGTNASSSTHWSAASLDDVTTMPHSSLADCTGQHTGGTATVRPCPSSRSLRATASIAAAAIALGSAGASALTQRAATTPKKITAAGVGAIKLGATYQQLRAAGLVGAISQGLRARRPEHRARPGCAARCSGGVDFTHDAAAQGHEHHRHPAARRRAGSASARRSLRSNARSRRSSSTQHRARRSASRSTWSRRAAAAGCSSASTRTTKKVTTSGSRTSRSATDAQPARTGSSAPSLTSVSASSAAGSESRTTPDPA